MAAPHKKGSVVDYVNICISLLNLAVVTIGGYLLVGRYESRLAETQASINEVELKFIELQSSLDIKGATLLSTSQVSDIISSAKPKFNFELDPEVDVAEEFIEIRFRLLNSGSHAITVSFDRIYLLKSAQIGDEQFDETDVIQMIEPNFDNYVNPMDEITTGFMFDVPKQRNFFYLAIFSATTDQDIVRNVMNNLGSIGIELGEEVFSTKQIRSGRISL